MKIMPPDRPLGFESRLASPLDIHGDDRRALDCAATKADFGDG